MQTSSPIFIHSLFRSGSTYIFDVFRRSSSKYWCYQESLHENAFWYREEPDQLSIALGSGKRQQLRHPSVLQPYYFELQETWPAWKHSISAEAIYDGYFAASDIDIGTAYFRSLIEAAKGRPVFQECRTSGRVRKLREQLSGFHIYLWRNPWDQWWSYKVEPYFDLVNQIILGAPGCPSEIKHMLDSIGPPKGLRANIADSFGLSGTPVTSERSYLTFYMLWCLGLREGSQSSQLLLNIDSLSESVKYREEICRDLAKAGIEGINFDDCHVPQGTYSEQEANYFLKLENQVHQWLIEGGWSEAELDQILTIRRKFEPATQIESRETFDADFLKEQASRARALTMRYETTIAETTAHLNFEKADLESKLNQSHQQVELADERASVSDAKTAEAVKKSKQAEQRATEAGAKTVEAKTLAANAAAQTEQAEKLAIKAEVQAVQAERQATKAEVQTEQAERLAARAEAQAEQAELRATEAEAKTAEAAKTTKQAEQRATEAKAKTEAAEKTAKQAEQRATEAKAKTEAATKAAKQAEQRATEAKAKTGAAEKTAKQAEQRATEAKAKTQAVEKAAKQAEQRALKLGAQAEATKAAAESLDTRLQAVYASASWKITFPFRLVLDLARNTLSLIGDIIIFLIMIPKRLAQALFKLLMLLALKSSVVEKLAMKFLSKHATLHSHLKAFAITHHVLTDGQKNHRCKHSEQLSLAAGLRSTQKNELTPELDAFSSDLTPHLTTDEIMTRLNKELDKAGRQTSE